MLHTTKSILFNWQFWFRLGLAFFIPLVLFSTLMTASEKAINESLGAQVDEPRLGLMGKEYVPSLLLERLGNGIKVTHLKDKNDIPFLIEEDSLDIVLIFPEGFYSDSNNIGTIETYYNSMQNRSAVESVLDVIEWYETQVVTSKITAMGLDKSITNPIKIQKNNTFNVFVTIGKVLENVKGVLSNILNLLFVLLIIWMVRNMVLRAEFVGEPKAWGINLALIFIATMVAMALVFIGFQSGMNTELEGMVKSLVLSVQQLLSWNKLSSFLWLWWPTWLFVIGLLGWITTVSKTTVSAYSRTYWAVMMIHFIAFVGLIPIKELSLLMACIPVLNVFGVGQMAMKGTLEGSLWWIALGASSFWAVVMNVLWYRAKNKKA